MTYNIDERQKNDKSLLDAEYELNGAFYPCQIINILSDCLTMRVKSFFVIGDNIRIKLDKYIFRAIVAGVDGNIITMKFEQLSDEKLHFIMDLKLSEIFENR